MRSGGVRLVGCGSGAGLTPYRGGRGVMQCDGEERGEQERHGGDVQTELGDFLHRHAAETGGGAHPERWLRDGELLDSVRGRLLVVAYEQGWTRCPFPGRPYPGAVQRLCAVRTTPATDGQQSRVPPLTAADAG